MDTQAGGSLSNCTITPGQEVLYDPLGKVLGGVMGGTFTQPQSPQPIGDVMTLVKTGNGEFVLSGINAQRLLREYFEQDPELWLRMLALKPEEDSG